MISFVYFDIGGVVIRDFSGTNKWEELLKDLGISSDKEEKFNDFWKKYEPEVCLGRDVQTLLPLIELEFNIKIPTNYSLSLEGFVNRFESNPLIWPIIEKIQKHCRIGLLTNMYPSMLNAIKKRGLLPRISWDVIIDSSIEHLKKPDIEIYNLAQEKASAKGNEILFIDNTENNLDATRKLDWNTFLYDPSEIKKSNQELLKLWDNFSK